MKGLRFAAFAILLSSCARLNQPSIVSSRSPATSANAASANNPLSPLKPGEVFTFALSASRTEIIAGTDFDLTVFAIDTNGLSRNVSGEVKVVVRGNNTSDITMVKNTSYIRVSAKKSGAYRLVVTHAQIKEAATIDLTVRDAKITSLIPSDASISLIEKTESRISIDGVYSDGIRRQLSTECTSQFDNSKLAMSFVRTNEGSSYVFKGLAEGSGSIGLTCAGKTIAIPFSVSKAKLMSLSFKHSQQTLPLYLPTRTTEDVQVIGTYDDGSVKNVSDVVALSSDQEGIRVLNYSVITANNAPAIRIFSRDSATKTVSIFASFDGKSAELPLRAVFVYISSLEIEGIADTVYSGQGIPFKVKGVYSDGAYRWLNGSDLVHLDAWLGHGEKCGIDRVNLVIRCPIGDNSLSVVLINEQKLSVGARKDFTVIYDQPVDFSLENVPEKLPLQYRAPVNIKIVRKSGASDDVAWSDPAMGCYTTNGPEFDSGLSTKLLFNKGIWRPYLDAAGLGVAYAQCSISVDDNHYYPPKTVTLKKSFRFEVINAKLNSLKIDLKHLSTTTSSKIVFGDWVVASVKGLYDNGLIYEMAPCLALSDSPIRETCYGQDIDRSGFPFVTTKPTLTVQARYGDVTAALKIETDFSSVKKTELEKCRSHWGQTKDVFQNEPVQFCLRYYLSDKFLPDYMHSVLSDPLPGSDLEVVSAKYEVKGDGLYQFKAVPISVKLIKKHATLPEFPAVLKIVKFGEYNSDGFYLQGVSIPEADRYLSDGKPRYDCKMNGVFQFSTRNYYDCACLSAGLGYRALAFDYPDVVIDPGPALVAKRMGDEDYPILITPGAFWVHAQIDAINPPASGYDTICYRKR